MKKLGYLLILISGICNAQIVNIPDANFKAKLLSADITNQIAKDLNGVNMKIDINDDGDIQESEALIVGYLDLGNSDITSLEGIKKFSNIKNLLSYSTSLISIDLSMMQNLEYVTISSEILTSINISNCPLIWYFNNGSFSADSVNLSNCTSLIEARVIGNTLDVTGCIALKFLETQYSNIQFLDLSNLLNLISLDSKYSSLTSLNLSGCTSFKYLTSYNSPLTDLNLIGCNSLETMRLSNCNLSTLDLSNCPLLNYFESEYGNSFTTLNFSNCENLSSLSLYSITLETLYLKNSKNEILSLNLPQVLYICADESQINSVQTLVGDSVVVNSYCSFTPGGNYNTISGNVKFDADNNGCDVNDLVQPNIRMNIAESNASGASFTNNSGNYSFYTQAGTFTVTPDVENPTWFNFLPNTADIDFADNNNNVATQDFCIAANGVHPDIEVVISPISPARPGFDAVYQITYKNKGNYTYIDGLVNLEYDDSVLDFVSTSQSPNSEGLGSIGWIFSNLLPFESRSIQVTFNVNAPTEIPALNIGDVLTFRVYSYPSEVDETPLDNEFIYNQTVVGSFDPNDITCLEGNSLPPSEIGNYLHYAINFENTGNYPAENIVVKTEVDATKFDINSLQLLATSNPVDARITGNKVEFIFQNIQLPIGGHGHILLKVKSKSSLVTGDSVAKRADIFFDYNAPIDTGFANTTFQTLSNAIFETDSTINVYPNPTTSRITINSDFDLKSIQVYDVQGRILETLIGANKILDMSDKANGVYFLKITTSKGSKIEKLIKK